MPFPYAADYAILRPAWLALPLVALFMLCGITRLAQVRGHLELRRSTVVWALIPLTILIFFAVTTYFGLFSGSGAIFGLLVLLVSLSYILTICRDTSLAKSLLKSSGPEDNEHFYKQSLHDKAQTNQQTPKLVSILTTIFAIVLIYLVLETPLVKIPNPILYEFTLPFLAELGLIFLLVISARGFSLGHGGLVIVVGGVFLVFGLANGFMLSFRDTVVTPYDLFALGTAGAVASGYTFVFTPHMIASITYFSLLSSVCSYMVPTNLENAGHSRLRHLVVGGVSTLTFVLCCSVVPYRVLGAQLYTYYTKFYYRSQGSLITFILACQDFPIEKPSDYTTEYAKELEASYAEQYDNTHGSSQQRLDTIEQFNSEQPSIIVVMDESFADLSIYDELHSGYTGPTFLKTGLDSALSSGALSVSVFGAGTCNSEFEFLTGENMQFVGSAKQPYTTYNLSKVPSLARQLSELGYITTAIHPNLATNWNRNNAYPELGFDNFLSIDDFDAESEIYHSGISDKATYNKVLDLLKSSDSPQFIFDVTMANHGGYDQYNIPSEDELSYDPHIGTYDQTHQLNEYLSCATRSDEDLEYLVTQLKELDRPVVLLYFGDHQPKVSSYYNDTWYTSETDEVHMQRLYQTVYTIWANYDVAGSDQINEQTPTTTSYLAARLLNSIGAPLTNQQKAMLIISDDLPAINAVGDMDSNGNWYETDDVDSPVAQLKHDLATISYLEFATKL